MEPDRVGLEALDDGVQAALRLVADPALHEISGRYLDQQHERRADAQPATPTRAPSCASYRSG